MGTGIRGRQVGSELPAAGYTSWVQSELLIVEGVD